ncbi:F-box/LRR-repeat protein 12 isoform X3 [Podarcis raffonei]|uniref:F-box/LRR-repeat protein 12 isoform X3 n=1 Tax=Podarcis raffonei TaxID=65483 RepID=UPI0023293CA4|nr:F-box/LRR-repeat protein 12 isoform X3 [Podarcis raffonei]
MERPGLCALPDSLLLRILECLPPRDRLGGARVCRRWRRLVRDKLLWRYLDLTPYKLFEMDEEKYADNFRTSKVALASSEISKLHTALAKDPYGHDFHLFPCGADTRQWEYFSGKCYYFSLKAVSWHMAKAQCEQQHSQLVIINSLAKQNFIQTRTRNERYWIGLHDQHTEGEWKWLDGSNYRTGFKNWKQGEPNSYQNQDEDCGQLWINGEWNDYTCSSESFYVCEKALPVKPTSASKRT